MLIKENKILLTRRFNTGWQDGHYGLPAGHLEPNETLVQGAVRETLEETGVTVQPEDLEFVHTMHRLNKYIDIFFTASTWEGVPRITEPDLCDDVRWFPLDNLPENMIPSIRHVIGQYLNHVSFSEFDSREED